MAYFIINDIVTFKNGSKDLKMRVVDIEKGTEATDESLITVKMYFKTIKKMVFAKFAFTFFIV